MIDQLLNAIRAANLPAPVYRTARELLDRTGSNGYARLSYAEAAGSAADNRAAVEFGIRIAELRQAKAQHAELMDVFSRIAAALEKGS